MKDPVKILLQTTIPFIENDWHVDRFSMLQDHLRSLADESGERLYDVTARNIEKDPDGNDALLSKLDKTDFDQLWLFAVDTGDGLTKADCEGITAFRQRGGGIFSTRDHHDLGSSICSIGGIGAGHYFHSVNCDPDSSRNVRDDDLTRDIDFPNYHSGSNGDFQKIEAVLPVHELLLRSDSSTIEFFPAHPHEGGVGVPAEESSARVIARGTSDVSSRNFNLIVAFESHPDSRGNLLGRGIAESSFHHLVDYNWDIRKGCPDFLGEAPGSEVFEYPERLDDIKTYASNVARWLAKSTG
ncbi:MAG: hypothetical protein R2681_18500 [Pyrinomonadaceae bacterium]